MRQAPATFQVRGAFLALVPCCAIVRYQAADPSST